MLLTSLAFVMFYTSWDSVPQKKTALESPRYLLQSSFLMYCTRGNEAEMQKGVKETIKGMEGTAAKLNDVFVVLCTSENEKEY